MLNEHRSPIHFNQTIVLLVLLTLPSSIISQTPADEEPACNTIKSHDCYEYCYCSKCYFTEGNGNYTCMEKGKDICNGDIFENSDDHFCKNGAFIATIFFICLFSAIFLCCIIGCVYYKRRSIKDKVTSLSNRYMMLGDIRSSSTPGNQWTRYNSTL